jgi:hypothetical protein
MEDRPHRGAHHQLIQTLLTQHRHRARQVGDLALGPVARRVGQPHQLADQAGIARQQLHQLRPRDIRPARQPHQLRQDRRQARQLVGPLGAALPLQALHQPLLAGGRRHVLEPRQPQQPRAELQPLRRGLERGEDDLAAGVDRRLGRHLAGPVRVCRRERLRRR